MWFAVSVALVAACPAAMEPGPAAPVEPARLDDPPPVKLDDRLVDFAFDGGQLEFELIRDGGRIQQLVRNRYAVEVTVHWTITALDNLEAASALDGTTVLPAAREPLGAGEPMPIAELARVDPSPRYRRQLDFPARVGD